MVGNSILNKSKHARDNDEFYTTYETIEEELAHYQTKFKNKCVLCNCDDPFESNFTKYFIKNFHKLGLKRLVCTSYKYSKVLATTSLLTDENNQPLDKKNGYILLIDKIPKNIDLTGNNIHDFIANKNLVRKLKGDGDFRSEECVKYLKQSDIIVTNPPFSLFRDWISLVIENRKQFLVIGNQNAITYKEIFPLIQKNQVWIGYHSGDMSFRVPADSKARNTRYWEDETGQKWRSLGNAMWLTNMDINKRHKKIELKSNYDPHIYPHYDKYDAIEVSRVSQIPMDFEGVMGVPITFLNKYNPEQFEIIGEANHGSDSSLDLFKPTVNGELKYKRILIRNKKYVLGEKKDGQI